jgi:hypothetical protein
MASQSVKATLKSCRAWVIPQAAKPSRAASSLIAAAVSVLGAGFCAMGLATTPGAKRKCARNRLTSAHFRTAYRTYRQRSLTRV